MTTTTTDLRRTPQQVRSKGTLGDILDAAAHWLVERPLAEITMEMIAFRAGVSKAAIYRYYPDRPAVLRAVAERALPAVHDAVADTQAQFRFGAETYTEMICDDALVRAVCVTAYSYADLGPCIAALERRLAERIAEDDELWGVEQWVGALREARARAELVVLNETAAA